MPWYLISIGCLKCLSLWGHDLQTHLSVPQCFLKIFVNKTSKTCFYFIFFRGVGNFYWKFRKKKEQHETSGFRVADCSQTMKLQWEMHSYFFLKKEEEEEEERRSRLWDLKEYRSLNFKSTIIEICDILTCHETLLMQFPFLIG